MRIKPKALVLKADGINRDAEMAFAFTLAGANAKIVHINELRSKREKLKNYHILALPGGFSYGDDIASGKIQATEMATFLGEALREFTKRKDTAIIGVCNGFQTLVRTGLLPFNIIGNMQTTLTNNDSGHFECRWVNLKIESDSKCVFLSDQFLKSYPSSEAKRSREAFDNGSSREARTITNDTTIVSYPIAHGEGKFFASNETIETIEQSHLVVFRYVDEHGNPTQLYPQNPNGALNAIAGVCDPTGRILGLMPHPECFVRIEQHPNWRRGKITNPHGLPLFENIVNFVKDS